jgi:hypothetical protein
MAFTTTNLIMGVIIFAMFWCSDNSYLNVVQKFRHIFVCSGMPYYHSFPLHKNRMISVPIKDTKYNKHVMHVILVGMFGTCI